VLLSRASAPAKHSPFVKGTPNKKPTSSDKIKKLSGTVARVSFVAPPGLCYQHASPRHSSRGNLLLSSVIRAQKMKRTFPKKEIFLMTLLRTRTAIRIMFSKRRAQGGVLFSASLP
jgi:hypothetical protein